MTKRTTEMKTNFFDFILYVYKNYIYEDWSVYTKFGKICIYPAWAVRSFFIWILSFLFIPEYLFKNSNFYKEFKKLQKTHNKL